MLRVDETTYIGQIRAAIRVRAGFKNENFSLYWKKYNVSADRYDTSYINLSLNMPENLLTLNIHSGAEIYIQIN